MTAHPPWCVRFYCTSTGYVGAHRSTPLAVEAVVQVTASLYAAASAPDVTLVEVHCGQTLLPAEAAYGLGRILLSLGRAARKER